MHSRVFDAHREENPQEVRKIKEDHEQLTSALMALTSHFAQVSGVFKTVPSQEIKFHSCDKVLLVPIYAFFDFEISMWTFLDFRCSFEYNKLWLLLMMIKSSC